MSETCDTQMAAVAGGGFIYCNAAKGHDGPHRHTYPYQILTEPQQEMVSLQAIRAALTRIEGQIKGLGDGLADALTKARDEITMCGAKNFVQLEKNLKRPRAKGRSGKKRT